MALKARTRELGTGPVPSPVRDFVIAQLTRDDLAGTGERRTDIAVSRSTAAKVFLEAVRRFG